METEIYETLIGIFRMVADLKKANLVQVQLFVSGHEGGNWENIGRMKRKEFLKMINPHKPRKREARELSMHPPDSFWDSYEG